MSGQNDGGPAFPVADTFHPDGQIQYGTNGMSLRDWFAGQALAGMLSSEYRPDGEGAKANWAYELADAMLRAREKGEAPEASGKSGASANAYTGVVLSRNWRGAQ